MKKKAKQKVLRKKSWYGWLKNSTSSKDDEPIRVEAKTKEEAYEAIRKKLREYPYINRFSIGWVMDGPEFKSWSKFWYETMRPKKRAKKT